MTIYRMYADNGNRAGFWVQHRSCATRARKWKALPGSELENCPATLHFTTMRLSWCDAFDVRSGRPLQPGPQLETPQDSHYRIIAQPGWYRGAKEVPAAVGSA